MFFALSKVLWWLVDPANLILAALLAGVAMAWRGWRGARTLVTVAALTWLFVAVVPVGSAMVRVLENRFPSVSSLPDRVDGIVVLGGVVDAELTRSRGQLVMGDAAERLVALAELANRFPDAKLVFSGGSGDILRPGAKEGAALAPYLGVLGLDTKRVIIEGESRNTYENAVRVRATVDPSPGGAWLLVTSARHMPRAVGCFRKVGFPVIPYPVDYQLTRDSRWALTFSPVGGLGTVANAVHEWLGLFAYWVWDRSESLFPAPDPAMLPVR